MAQAPQRIAELLELVPSFRWVSLKYVRGWEDGHMVSGKVRPFDVLGITGVAALLDSRASLALDQFGRLLNPGNQALTTQVDISSLDVNQEFEFEFWIPGDGSHPQLFVVSPRISRETFPNHIHLHVCD